MRTKAASAGRTRSAKTSQRGRGADQAYSILRDKILHLELAPGSKLDEMALVKELGCSRTPVREALIRLAGDGLAILMPRYGARVAPLDLVDVAQYFEAFEISQRIANHLAAARHTDTDLKRIKEMQRAFDDATKSDDAGAMIQSNRDFHVAISQAACNSYFHTMAVGLLDQGMRLNWIWHGRFEEERLYRDIARSRVDHAQIVAAIEAGDAPLAEKLGATHAAIFRNRLMDFLSQNRAKVVALWSSDGAQSAGGKRLRQP